MSQVVLPKGVLVSQAILANDKPGVRIDLSDAAGQSVSLVYPEQQANDIALAILEVSIAIREGRGKVIALPARKDGQSHSPSSADAPPGRVASRLPSRAVEPSRPVASAEATFGDNTGLAADLMALGATVEAGDKPGILVVDGKRMGVFGADEYRHKLKRIKARAGKR